MPRVPPPRRGPIRNLRILSLLRKQLRRTPAFSPSSVAGLVGWYDASDLATLFQNSDGTGEVAGDDPVGYWGDKSGEGNHALQSVNNNRPLLRTDQWNGKPVADFDGSDDMLLTGVDFDFETTKEVTICVVANVASGDGNFVALKRNNGDDYLTGLATDYGLYSGTAMAITFGIGSGSSQSDYADRWATVSEASTPFVAAWRIKPSTATLSIRVNGAEESINAGSGSMQTAGFLSGGSGLHRAFIGARGWAADNDPTRWHGGKIAEVLIYNASVSDAAMTQIETYLAAKWGLA
jgi:hypothetical protein